MDKKRFFSPYLPLLSLILIAIAASWALVIGRNEAFLQGMHYFMGIFFCQFAMFKLFDLKGFVENFEKYDLLAVRFRAYGYAYPFIELFLGLGYLSFTVPYLVCLITVAIMALGVVGIVKALHRGLNTHCACMGTFLKVPLSTVSLVEDVGMGLMALYMIILALF